MINIATQVTQDQPNSASTEMVRYPGEYQNLFIEDRNRIENHRTSAKYLQTAAKFHLDAARFHEIGDHEKAAHSTLKANGFIHLATDLQSEDAKQHALNG